MTSLEQLLNSMIYSILRLTSLHTPSPGAASAWLADHGGYQVILTMFVLNLADVVTRIDRESEHIALVEIPF